MIKATVRGLPDLKAALQGIVPKLQRRALRNALAAAGRVVRDEARRQAPALSNTLKAPYRTPGLLRKSIMVRTSKLARRAGAVGVFVNVRPAKRGVRGAKSKLDPYYWRWVEFGTKKMGARPYLQPAVQRLPQAFTVFASQLGPAVAKLNRPKAPAP